MSDARKYLQNIMFWDNDNPRKYIITIDEIKKYFIVGLLRSGKIVNRNKGYTKCKICGDRLGSCDIAGWGFIWPEGAEHYVEVHSIWLADFDRLLEEYDNRNKTKTVSATETRGQQWT